MTFQSVNKKAFLGLLCGSDETTDEKIFYCPSTFDNLSSTDEWTCGKAKQNISKQSAQSIVLGVYDGLEQVLAAGVGSIQQHTTLNNRDQSFYDANRKKAIKRQQELKELSRRNTAQAQMRQRRKYDEKILQAKPYAAGQNVWVFQNVIPSKGTKNLLKKRRGPFMIAEVHQQGRFYRLSTGHAAHYENLKPRGPSPEYWSVPQSMEGLEYLIMEPACEVNKKSTTEENDGNGNMSIGEVEKVEVNLYENSFAEEDCNEPGQKEVPGRTKPDKPMTMETRRGGRKKTSMRYNRYGDDFVIYKIQPNKVRGRYGEHGRVSVR